jgi:uncharacterized membrane protein
VTNPLFILGVLCLNVVICEWLTKKPGFSHIGTALLVILLTAIESNFGLIPTTEVPVYDGIFSYLAPFALFLLLLSVNLKDLKQAGLPTLTMYLTGSVGVIIGVFVSVWLFDAQKTVGPLYYALAGMFTGTYIGGSVNFHAVALHYGVSKAGNLFIAATAADNIMTTLWMMASLTLPRVLQGRFPRKKAVVIAQTENGKPTTSTLFSDADTLTPNDLAKLLTLGFAALWVSKQIAALVPGLPFVLVLTTIALVLAQFRTINNLPGTRLLGLFGVYLFLAVIGAYCDVAALLQDGQLAVVLFGMIFCIVAVHALILFGIGAALKQDWDILAIASQANIGGATSALALARSLARADLQLPAVLVGTLGNAIGTYLGILMAEWLH